MAKNFPKLLTNIKPQIPETQRTPKCHEGQIPTNLHHSYHIQTVFFKKEQKRKKEKTQI